MKGLCFLLSALASLGTFSAVASTFTVTATNDSGAGSLRQAMLDANAAPGLDTIGFNLASGTTTIVLAAALPPVTDPLTIDGSTQPGFAGVPVVEVQGTNIVGAGTNGFRLWAGGSTLRSLVINRFTGNGVEIATNGNNVIEGCYIGVGLNGTNALRNLQSGIFITNSANNRIGGAAAAARNVISGNSQHGVHVGGTNSIGNQILGNLIGLGATGSNVLANALNGVLLFNARSNTIGGTSAGAGNVISGNSQQGVRIENTNAWGNQILGNLIGLEITGTTNRANGNNGVYLLNAGTNTVGGTTTAARNVISANGNAGVRLENAGANGNVIAGNFIGTDATGALDRGNAQDGILIVNAPANSIGGPASGAGNVISGNSDDGIEIQNTGAGFNLVLGNRVGLAADGLSPLGNGGHGVQFTLNARTNTIGGPGAGEANRIAFNAGDGVFVNAGTNNSIRANAIYSNTGLGLDLGVNGVTANDLGDGDGGANQLQNFPTITAAVNSAAGTELSGTLNSGASLTYTLDFYANVLCDASGNGEGQTYLGSGSVTTDGSGNGSFVVALPSAIVLAGRFITATATDPFGNTSEFSPCFSASSSRPGQTFTVVNTNDAGPGSLRQAITDANAAINAGDTIGFNIPGAGVQSIRLASVLPAVIDPVTIDGTTQPGAGCPTSTSAFDGAVLIRIDGTNLPAASSGLRFTQGGNTVRGLQIVSFSGDGLAFTNSSGNVIECNLIGVDEASVDRGNGSGVTLVNSAASIGGDPARRNVISGNTAAGLRLLSGSSGSVIRGNWIGLNLAGTTNRANGDGILLSTATGNTIGGSAPGQGNVISGNATGVNLASATNNSISGNFIGTSASGTFRVANTGDGVNLSGLSLGNSIGGSGVGAGNLISGNGGDGVEIGGTSQRNSIAGNLIGLDLAGASALGNGGHGVNLSGGYSNQVGSALAGGNAIAFNTADGVSVATAATNNAIRFNRIFSNGDLGVDLGASGVTTNDPGDGDAGANRLQNFPLITAATNTPAGTAITVSLNSTPNTAFAIDLYSNFTCDGSGHGEGQSLLGSTVLTTDAAGNGSVAAELPVTVLTGRYLAATATDPLGNTSEFGPCFFAQSTVAGQTFTVVNTNDAGPGSLRQAILDANAAVNAGDTIAFDLPGAGVRTISPVSALPIVTDPVVIDGYTQSGSAVNTAANGFNGTLLVRLDGAGTPAGTDGLRVSVGGSTIRGLFITGFKNEGIELSTNGNNVIEGNIVGLNPTNGVAANAAVGVNVNNTSGNRIGGLTPAARNVISGNGTHGILIAGAGATSNLVAGNFVGTDPAGALDRGNSADGIQVSGAAFNTIGGSVAARNVLSGNNGSGVTLAGAGCSNNLVLGNRVGTDVNGALALGNTTHGVNVAAGASGNVIGTTGPGTGNRIAFNGQDGVNVATAATNNSIRATEFFLNGDLAVDLGANGVQPNDAGDADVGANQLQNFPVLTSAVAGVGTTTINGTLNSAPNTTFALDFFANYACDPLGNGEGAQYLGSTTVTTDGSGNASFAAAVAATVTGHYLTATATDPLGNTSEFSPCLYAPSTAPGQTFVVVNTNDAGPGSLRQAILDANVAINSGDTILFNIPGAGPQVIRPSSALPPITDPVFIDGYSQPGATTNSSPTVFTGTPFIQIDGASAGPGVDGLRVAAGPSLVRGLAITSFGGDGIEIATNGNSVVEGCLLGLVPAGVSMPNGGSGVRIFNAPGNRVGGAATGARNVISGNSSSGVQIDGVAASNNIVVGNLIGLDPTGALDTGNAGDGVQISDAPNNVVGGPTAAERNVISGNNSTGIEINALNGSGNRVLGNFIGTDATGALPVGNGSFGVFFNTSARNNVVGGPTPGAGNLIAFNGSDGVDVNSGTNNAIRGNAIFANGTAAGDLGLDLGTSGLTPNDPGDTDTGPNQLQNFPSLSSAVAKVGNMQVAGTLNSAPNTLFQLDFFANPACDTGGSGEGQIFLGSSGVTTDGSGNAAFAVTLVASLTNRYITATATDPFGNTSEFSPCVRAESTIPPSTFTVLNTASSGPGSLRQAIVDNNSTVSAAPNTIRFAIPGPGLQTVVLSTRLPLVTEPVVIDGLTQPGASANTLAQGNNANLLIRLSGTNAGASADGLRFASGGNTVRGLVIVGFSSDGIELTSTSSVSRVEACFIGIDVDGVDHGNAGDGILVNGSPNNVIGGSAPAARNVISGNNSRGVEIIGAGATGNLVQGNYLGTDLAGAARVANNGDGILISGAALNVIGGTASGARNVVSGNFNDGVEISGAGASNNVVTGNFIGTDASGLVAIGNSAVGVFVSGAAGNAIGGAAAGAGNVISANSQGGLGLTGPGCANNVVQGNRIGTDAAGTLDLRNLNSGINVSVSAHDNTIGGTGAGEGNIVAYSQGDGLAMSGTGTINNLVRGNRFFLNTDLALDLGTTGVTANDVGDADNGPNQLQNFPVLTAATNNAGSVTVAGTLSSGTNVTYGIDFYSNPGCDAGGNGEGETYLGSANVTTDGGGTATFLVTLPGAALVGRQVTATATDPLGNTSEFGPCVRAFSTLPPQTFVVINTNDSGPGSLRAALLANNAAVNASANLIRFSLPGAGPFPIAPLTRLPDVSEPVVIDGYTQPGASPNTLTNDDNAAVQIVLSGERLGTDVLNLVADDCIVRGLSIVQPGSSAACVNVQSGGGNRIEGCFLGLLPDGLTVRGRFDNQGVRLANATVARTTIGGTTPAARNIISGHSGSGIFIQNSPSNLIAGNFIGTDRSGRLSRPNTNDGVTISGAQAVGNVIGGTNPPARNVISGNRVGQFGTFSENGIELSSSAFTTIQGNYIGVDVTGTNPLPNGDNGIRLSQSSSNLIGGVAPGAGNVIAGNRSVGLLADFGSDGNVVQGNLIGVDATGARAVENQGGGVEIDGAEHTLLGGLAPGAGNVISGNRGEGVRLFSDFAATLQGNFIGTDRTAVLDLGNNGMGIHINASGNRIENNTIAHNRSVGVFIGNGTANRVTANSIHDNAELGLALNSFGGNLNDPGDGDTGPNDLQNYPIITDALRTPTGVSIAFRLNSATNRQFRVEFFDNVECDLSGNGEGQTYLGFVDVSTDGSGNAAGVFTLGSPLAIGHFITATATDTNGNTSEFAACRKVVPFDSVDLDVTVTPSADPSPLASNLVYTVTIANLGPTNAAGVTLTDRLPAGANFIGATASQGSCAQAAGVVTCGLGNINRDGQVTVTITVRPTSFGSASNFAAVATAQTDHSPENNSFSLLSEVGVADLVFAISDAPDPATAGLPLTYTVTVVNIGPDAAPNAGLNFYVFPTFCPSSASVSAGTFFQVGNDFECRFGSLPVNGVGRLTVNGVPTDDGQLFSGGSAASNLVDPVPGNNFLNTSTTTLPGAGVLQFQRPFISVGEEDGTVTIEIIRTGGSAGEVSAVYRAFPGSATPGQDYTPVTGTVVFPDGVTSRLIQVPIRSDNLNECNEAFSLQLSSPSGPPGATVLCVATNVTVMILENDLTFDGVVQLVSANTNQPPASASGYSDSPSVSADGRFVVFRSRARDLVPGDLSSNDDVFLRDLAQGTTARLSDDANIGAALLPIISGDGGRVVFTANVAGPGSTIQAVLAHRRDLDTNEPVTVRPDGSLSVASGFGAGISSNGTVVAFQSAGADLVNLPDANGSDDVFARNLVTRTTVLVSVNTNGAAGNGQSWDAKVSADGRFVVFTSLASDLVAGDTNRGTDVFVRDLVANTTTLVSRNLAGNGAGNGQSFDAVISANGRFVAFTSDASNLAPGDTNDSTDVFLRDLAAGNTMLVSLNRFGTASGDLPSEEPSLSADGRRVAFHSFATDLVANDGNGDTLDVFVRDMVAGVTTLVSSTCDGAGSGSGPSYGPVISGDGVVVVFQTAATDLVPGRYSTSGGYGASGFGRTQIMRRDLATSRTELVSHNYTLTGAGEQDSQAPVLDFHGTTVAFVSNSSDLTVNDNNFTFDVFAWSTDFTPPDPQPTLTITRTTDTEVTLSWPSPSTGYILERTDLLGLVPANTTWSPVGAAVVDDGAFKRVTLPIGFNVQTRFFRLKKM